MPDALLTYKAPLYELPTDLDIDNPRVLTGSNQKRVKTDSNSVSTFHNYQPPPISYREPPVLKTRSRLHPNGIGYGSNFQNSMASRLDYNPAIDCPTYAKKSPHLNELSQNLNNYRHNQNDVGIVNMKQNDILSSMNLKPLRSNFMGTNPPSLPRQRSTPNQNMNRAQFNTSQITGSNDNGNFWHEFESNYSLKLFILLLLSFSSYL